MVDGVGTTHHVKLGSSHLLVHPNSYFKRAAPVFGARFSGGDPDYSLLNFWQHWGQSCWIGGMGQASWEDDAMYDYAVGVDTSQHDLVSLSRGFVASGGNSVLTADPRRRRFHVWNDRLYAFDHLGSAPATIYKYLEASDAWSSWKTFDNVTMGAAASFSSDFYVGTSGRSLRKYASGSWKAVRKPKGRTETPRMMYGYRGRLYVGLGRRLYRLKPNDKWDGNAIFFDGKGIDHYVDAVYHQGFLYLVSRNGHIVRTDGNQTYDLYQFGGHAVINGVESYDGNLFIFTNEWYDDDEVGELVVYQMSGAAVTEIARYGRVGTTIATKGSVEVARRMFYGAPSLLGASPETGFGIAVYDAREDAHSLFACQRNTTTYPESSGVGTDYIVDDVAYWGKKFMALVRGHGCFEATYTHRDTERDIASYDMTWTGVPEFDNHEGGVLVSSDFDAGTPSLQKIWRTVSVTADLVNAAASVNVAYSLDGGRTWVSVGSVTKTGAATRYTQDFTLTGIRSERFKYKLTLVTTDAAYSPFVRSVVVGFLPDPEPNWVWQFTAVLAENVELLDGTEVTQDVDALKAALETAFRDTRLVYFEDIDGGKWYEESGVAKAGVLIQDITFSAPFIGPSSDGAIEYTVQLSLIEAVEQSA